MTEEQLRKFERRYQESYKMLRRLAYVYLQNPSLAEEAVQETFRIATEHADAFLNSSNPEGWLVSTLKYTSLNLRRSESAYRRLLAKATALYENDCFKAEDLLTVESLREDITQTTEFQFLKLFVYDGLSTLEVAQRFGITVNACRVRKYRAIKVLREKLLEKK